MKKIKFLVLIALAINLSTVKTADAQSRDNDGGFGIKGGIGLSTISFGDPKNIVDGEGGSFEFRNNDNKWKIGGLVGITYEARIGNVFGIDIEALIVNKGVKRELEYKVLGQDGKLTMTGNLFTLDVPVSAKFYFGDNFNINAGPYFSYIIGGKAKAKNVLNGNTTSDESNNWYGDDYKDANGELPLKHFDVGVNIGIEVVANAGFGVGARFQKGFIDLTNDKYKGTFSNEGLVFPGDDKHVTNTGFQIYGIFRF